MAGHQFLARREIEQVPVILALAAFVHGIKGHHFPVGHFRVKPVFLVFLPPFVQFGQALVEGFAVGLKLFLLDELLAIIFVGGAVLRKFGNAQKAVDLLKSCPWKAAFQRAMHLGELAQLSRIQDKAEVGFSTDSGVTCDARMRRRTIRRAKRLQRS